MKRANPGLCNQCQARVPSDFFRREGQLWIRKSCPDCGDTESLVSSDAEVWQEKRDMWQYIDNDSSACSLHCDRCRVNHKPNLVFVDVTNRCNMNCPICIATIRGMGFDFNPPLDYFERLFSVIGKMDPNPMVELFGGEPTMREDLLDIIAIGRTHGIRPRVVTNGIRLADEDYCRKLCEANVRIRIAFDGRSPEIYEKLRRSPGAYEKKMKAFENLKKHSRRKHAIVACAAKGINDKHLGDLIQFCHDNRDLISDLGIIPLTENWKPGEFDAAVHTTMEDVEKMVMDTVPGGQVEFIPAGLSYALRKPRSFFRPNTRSEVLLLAGVHPNCESMTLLVSDGKSFRSIRRYLKKPFKDVAVSFAAKAKQIEPKLDRLDPTKWFQRLRGRLLILRTFGLWSFGNVKVGKVLGEGLVNLVKGLFRSGKGPTKARRPRRIIRVAMLPFEEYHSIDGVRMENCKAVFAFEDAQDSRVKFIPACMWYPYRNPRLEAISKKHGVVRYTGEKEEAAATA